MTAWFDIVRRSPDRPKDCWLSIADIFEPVATEE
jgi:hypothetical protein